MFSPTAAEHIQKIRNRGALEGATAVGTAGTPGEGAFVRIWLRIDSDRIADASYDTHGCPASVAAASVTATLAKGRYVEHLSSLTSEDLLVVLGGLPEGKEQFASLAVSALHAALNTHNRQQSELPEAAASAS